MLLEGVANEKILNELNKRLDDINIDGIIDSNYINELIRDSPLSPFETIGSTERPDVVAGKLLEGRIAVVVDGSPVVLTLPHIFLELFQSSEDYYLSFYFSSISRVIRILGFVISVCTAAIYIAVVTYHQEMIPTPLVLSISAARQNVPFPTIVESLGMLLIFEILRETGTRMPTYIGQALSIVGALVVGQAAVDAKFISAPIVIVTALTGITGLMIPKLKAAAILFRITLSLLASFLGMYGFTFGIIGIILHLLQLRSFGIPYILNLSRINSENIKDTVIRAPWWYMKYRPKFISPINTKRQSGRGKK
jgi:spore germination protein KA